jgi:5-methylcytosine-specific restriction endonuclease McrA
MRALDAVPWDDEAAHIKAAKRASKGGRAVACNLFAILDRIDEYRRNALTHQTIAGSPIAINLKDDLISLYAQPAVAFKDLLALVRSRSPDCCPYCGRQASSQIDHLFEKDIYPEFAVLSINLVYVCDKCNRSKLPRNENGLRNFVMPSFDRFLETLILSCHISTMYDVLGFRLLIPHGLPIDEHELLQRHLITFKISKEFSTWAGRYFDKLVATRANERRERPLLQQWIAMKMQTYETEIGLNSREAILARGLAANTKALAMLDARAAIEAG